MVPQDRHVCGNGESSISTACAVHIDHLKLINCDQYARHKKTSKVAVFHIYSMQGFKILRANATDGRCCLSCPVMKTCTAVVTPSSGSAALAPDPRLQLSHWLHQVTKKSFVQLKQKSSQFRTLNVSFCSTLPLIVVNMAMLTANIALLPMQIIPGLLLLGHLQI